LTRSAAGVLRFLFVPLEGFESRIFNAAEESTIPYCAFFSLARAKMAAHSSGETVLILSAQKKTIKIRIYARYSG
jgi:hypothetical protein